MTRPERRHDRNMPGTDRRTYSAYLSVAVMDAMDALVAARVFPNRSEAIEEACRRLVIDTTAARVSIEREAA